MTPRAQLRYWYRLALAAFGLGLAITVPPAARADNPVVDQAPLTTTAQLPPNMVLMFDDSGSMDSDYMPDNPVNTSNDGYRNSVNNGTYYNPAVTYAPPPRANGSSWPQPTFPCGYSDPFSSTTAPTSGCNQSTTDITNYYNDNYAYYTALQVADTTRSAAATTCDANGDTLITSGTRKGQCQHTVSCNFFGCTYTYYTLPYCASGTLDTATNQCVVTTTYNKNFFTYTVPRTTPITSSTSFTRYYVGQTGDCAKLTSSTAQATCADDVPTQQNVANWFSYYRKRILMAKSGLMAAFNDLAPTIRFGYGSINGRATSQITSDKGAGFYPFSTATNSSNRLARVATFDSNCTPPADPNTCTKGQSGTQRANFWDWLVAESPNGNTPLRGALNAVGTYYTTDQPWQSSSTDTSKLECRQAYTILTTDGFWNESTTPTLTTISTPSGDTVTLPSLSSPSDIDSTAKVTHVNPVGGNFSYDGTKTAALPWKDSYNSTYSITSLADVAMYYWLMDLQPSLTNKVPVSPGVDPAFWQHMTTFTVGLGYTPTGITPSSATVPLIFKWANDGGGTGSSAPSSQISNFKWPQPVNNTAANIADLAHAAVNGHGGFYSANNPEEFSSGIADALKRVSQRAGSGASLAANSTKLDTGTRTYQATYQSGVWTGDLTSYTVNASTGAISGTANWSASAKLPAYGSRVIKTYNGTAMVDFVASGASPAMTTTQLAYFGSSATDRTKVINYLRGDTSNEQRNGGSLRNRPVPAGSVNSTAPMGDIVDSQPVYVGTPDPNLYNGKTFTGSSAYSAFATNSTANGGVAGRQATVWVAANDGMLHAFNADTGVETFAYLPAAVLPSIKNYSDQDYGSNSLPHQYYNDGLLTVSDIYDNAQSKWRTILVGTTGRGAARAVYAFDVSSPSSVSLLWEHSASEGGDYAYIGQIVGQPIIAQTADATWSVLLGNGFNSASGTAALLQFDVLAGTISKITTDTNTGNGLAAPAVWMSNPANGISTTAYAGDVLGRVWSFTLSSGTSSNIFIAKDGTGTGARAQPITAGMLAGKDPATGNVWIFFGTGKYLTSSDFTAPSGGWSTAVQTWYGLIVQAGSSGYSAVSSSTTRSNLAQRTIAVETSASGSSLAARGITTPTAGDVTLGWYMDLVSPGSAAKGERMVTPNQFQGTLLIGTTRLPTTNSNSCNPSGNSWIMAINPFTGAPPGKPFFDTTQNGTIDDSDNITSGSTSYVVAGVGFDQIANNPIFVGNDMLISYDNATLGNVQTAGTTGTLQRLTWRELITQ
ncbi:pilus assembly protein [Solimonas soli]|uniref:pilus assembly protein n=1 Tax=Solimonas soli TaxID=413479 RepID=UPI0004B1D90D|nr:PilC/PilY family type IV pilus protein [Solimonas soli]